MSKLSFSKDFSCNKFTLFELSSDLVEDLRKEKSFTIKGTREEEAILCTKENSYLLKLAETSNTLLFTKKKDKLEDCVVTIGQGNQYYELIETLPRIGKVKQILTRNLYSGDEETKEKISTSTYDLLCVTQASEKQLLNYLDEINAFEYNGNWRLFQDIFIEQCFDLLLSECVVNDWDIYCISENECYNSISPITTQKWIAPLLLKKYSRSLPFTNKSDNTTVYWKLDILKIAQFKAQQLLRKSKNHNKIEFENKIREIINEFTTNIKKEEVDNESKMIQVQNVIEGIGVLLEDNITITALDKNELSDSIQNRFTQLFQCKKSWHLNEIKPYISSFVPPKQTVDQFLLKYTRACPGGIYVQK